MIPPTIAHLDPEPPIYAGATPGQVLAPWGRPGAIPRPPVILPRDRDRVAVQLARAVRVVFPERRK